MITETTGQITLIPENIPAELTGRPQWVVWRYERREGKWTKIPRTPSTGLRASSTDLMTWASFEEALAAYDGGTPAPPYDGIGFVFSSADPYVGIDLDDCRDPESGELAGWAREILERVASDAYVEVSPSGTGIHIVVEGSVRGGGMRRGSIEMYSMNRYFALTGHVL
jgi:putative DNA primase/helicase